MAQYVGVWEKKDDGGAKDVRRISEKHAVLVIWWFGDTRSIKREMGVGEKRR